MEKKKNRMVKPSSAEWVSESKVVDNSKAIREREKKEMAMKERDREVQECLKDKVLSCSLCLSLAVSTS